MCWRELPSLVYSPERPGQAKARNSPRKCHKEQGTKHFGHSLSTGLPAAASAGRRRGANQLSDRCYPCHKQESSPERKRDKDTGHCGVGILHSTASPVPNTQPSTGLEGSHSHGHMQARSHCGPPLCRGGTLRKTAFSCRLKNCKPGYGAAQQLRLCDFSCRKSP